MSASTFRVEPTTLVHPASATAVAKELVHRASAAEVMVADWRPLDADRFAVTALWPRGHSFFTSIENDRYDPLLLAETMRQASTLVSHTGFGVPLGHQFLLHELRVAVQPQHLSVGDAPAVLDIELTCAEATRRGNTLTGARFQAVLRRAGAVVATATTRFTVVAPGVYRRLRGSHAGASSLDCPRPAASEYPPQSVGRVAEMDVVLSPGHEPNSWQLRTDSRHPVFFDHPLDHVPGMLLLESARQAAARVLGRSSLLLSTIAGDFHQYVELDAPCTIDARRFPQQIPGGEEIVLVTGHQDGELRFSATVTASSAVR